MDKVEILLKEYDTLRSEVISGLNRRNTILSIGIAAVGLICSSAVAFADDNPKLTGYIFTFGIPAICIIVVWMWFNEYVRVQKAGIYLYGLESKINNAAGRRLLTYETEIRNGRQRDKHWFDPAVALPCLIGLGSVQFGLKDLSIFVEWKKLVGCMLCVVILEVYAVFTWRIGYWRKKR